MAGVEGMVNGEKDENGSGTIDRVRTGTLWAELIVAWFYASAK